MFEDFKKFALKGNVLDMAVGVIIGAAFGKIVSSFVGSVLTPLLGLLLGGVDLTGLKITLKEAMGEQAAVTLDYGVFLQSVVDFLIVAASIFLAIRALTSLDRRKKAEAVEAPPAEPSAEVKLLQEIRDALKK